jgi:hypothetical protein
MATVAAKPVTESGHVVTLRVKKSPLDPSRCELTPMRSPLGPFRWAECPRRSPPISSSPQVATLIASQISARIASYPAPSATSAAQGSVVVTSAGQSGTQGSVVVTFLGPRSPQVTPRWATRCPRSPQVTSRCANTRVAIIWPRIVILAPQFRRSRKNVRLAAGLLCPWHFVWSGWGRGTPHIP